MSNSWSIEEVYDDSMFHEFSIEFDGIVYQIIFGTHANGGFCAIPRLGVSCELSSNDKFSDTGYNRESLKRVLKNDKKSRLIAQAIHEIAAGL